MFICLWDGSWAGLRTVFAGVNCAWLECGVWEPLLPCSSMTATQGRELWGSFPLFGLSLFITDSSQIDWTPWPAMWDALCLTYSHTWHLAACPVSSSWPTVVGHCRLNFHVIRGMWLRLVVPALPDSSPTLAGTWSHLEDLYGFSGNTLDISLPTDRAKWKLIVTLHLRPKFLLVFLLPLIF